MSKTYTEVFYLDGDYGRQIIDELAAQDQLAYPNAGGIFLSSYDDGDHDGETVSEIATNPGECAWEYENYAATIHHGLGYVVIYRMEKNDDDADDNDD